MKSINLLAMICSIAFVSSCSGDNDDFDAFGHFETTEINVFAENPGQLIEFIVEPGMILNKDQVVGLIDTSSIALNIKQVEASIKAAMAGIPGILSQERVVQKEIEIMNGEIGRLEGLVSGGAASRKQLDDMVNQKEVATARLMTFKTQIDAVRAETGVLKAKLDLYNDQLEKSVIKAPLDGTVLERFTSKSELVTPGKLLFTMADLNNMELKAYVSGEQLSQIEAGQEARVRIDWEEGSYREYSGKIIWISSEAEFTPKIIQTKEERVNLVYAIRIFVRNDGKIKIGMPGEVIF